MCYNQVTRNSMYPAESPVAIHGQLHIEKGRLTDAEGRDLQLRGMSTHGVQWYKKYYCKESLDTLTYDWKIDILRIAMYVHEEGYIEDPEGWKSWIDQLVDECAIRGIYCLIDWHILTPGDPNIDILLAKDFWEHISQKHSGKAHVLYEICNEPNQVEWNSVVRYANEVIPIIRKNDSSTIIIVGTPTWSQDVDIAAENPLKGENLMYALHFYAGTHTQWLRDKAEIALNKGLALFVTEFGTSDASGDNAFSPEETRRWIDWMNKKGISWINWSYADKAEVSAALQHGAFEESDWNRTSDSGTLIKEMIKESRSEVNTN